VTVNFHQPGMFFGQFLLTRPELPLKRLAPRTFLGKFHVRSVRRALESRTLPLKLVQTLLQVDRFPAFLSQRRVRLQQALIPFGHGRVLRLQLSVTSGYGALLFTNRLFTRSETRF
tara:strand:+ start:3952 stop:4299 length:348 start_codon:yes stop_codon:yes gene_type:complete